jgi:CHAT domain-containing protein/Tfp pilus assembly protein PilF
MLRGQTRFYLSDNAVARNDLETALAMANSMNDSALRAEIEIRLGAFLARTHEFGAAESYIRNALATAQKLGDRFLTMNAVGDLGFLFLTAFRFEDAIYWLERAREFADEFGAQATSAKTQGNLGWCYYRLGDLDKALPTLDEAAQRSGELGLLLDQETALGNSGSVLYEQRDYAGAAARYEHALQIATSQNDDYSRAWWLNNLINVSIDRGDLGAADELLLRAQQVKEAAQAAGAKLYIDVTAARIALGRKYYERAEGLFRVVTQTQSEDPTPRLEAEDGLALVFAHRGETAKADRQFQDTLAFLEQSSARVIKDDYKISYRSSLIRFYQDYIDYLIANNRTEEALGAVEENRARLLREKLALGSNSAGKNKSKYRELARAAHATLLSYWIGPERSYLWVVTRDRIQALPLPGEAQIRRLVEAQASFIEGLRDPLLAHDSPAEQLYQLLIAPAAESIGPNGNVILVPDSSLYGLNFETLVDPQSRTYWIERTRLAIAPSLLALTAGEAGFKRGRASLLLIGDPDSPGPEYPKLAYASHEMDLVKEYLAAPRTTVLRGGDARPEAYRISEPRAYSMIHFAAHASANRESPLDSAVMLSGKPGEYALSARAIMGVPLDAQLVTISGCRGAGARVYAGEGLVGLSWAFLQAGARSVIAGLWDVNDRSTADLMGDLYRGLASGQDAEDALRAAKLKMIHGGSVYRKPYYWGAFQIYVRRVGRVSKVGAD